MTTSVLPLEGLVLRLPPDIAEEFRKEMSDGGSKWSVGSAIEFTNNGRTGTFTFGEKKYPLALVDLPCFIEMQKTFDNANYFKCGDISQMIVVFEDEEEMRHDTRSTDFRHGLTPPTYDIRRKRIQKKGFKKPPDSGEIRRVNNRLKVLMGLEEDDGGLDEDYEVIFAPEDQLVDIVGQEESINTRIRASVGGGVTESDSSEENSESSGEETGESDESLSGEEEEEDASDNVD